MNETVLKTLALDLTRESPRSPRVVLGGYVILARCLDKCRADLVGLNGDYRFWPCSLCQQLELFTQVPHEAIREFASTGATDDEVGEWFVSQSVIKDPMDVTRWNHRMRDLRISEMSDEEQTFLESYITDHLPTHPPVYVWFDVFDIEEGRIS